ncbi:hypothetical protein [Paenibacillus polysaccharolyticus]|uniref:hypothetical protein n=1 Tax=Paenibacillus polysaccharolyticus TaxID=582692 RepID=UPI00280AFD3E|nr:hypothetical protein [Paenibacillus polysaccharolyticus]
MNEKVKGKLHKLFLLSMLFAFLIGMQVAASYLVNYPPVWATVVYMCCFILVCIAGLLIYLDLKKQEQFITTGQIVDVKSNNIIVVKGLGRGNTKIIIKDSHILNIMRPNDLIEITRLKYTKTITKKVYQDQEIQL